jgi:hypothetical protein
MRTTSKLLMMSTAALLAGTLAAASQSIQPGGGAQDKEKGASGSQMSQPGKALNKEPSGKEEAAPNRNSQAQVKEPAGGQAKSKDLPTTTGQAKGKEAPTTNGQATGGRDDRVQRDQEKKPQGQTQREPDRKGAQTEGQNQREPDRKGGQTEGQAQPGQMQRNQGTQQGQREGDRSGGVSVSFTPEQRTKIRDVVLKERDAPRVSKVDFSLNVGTVVPRTVRVVAVPDVIVQYHPEWRGFRYFLVNDQLVIVEPDTLKIVAIVDV